MTFRRIVLPAIIACLLGPISSWGQSWPDRYFAGYSSSVTGGNFEYHSPQPDVGRALLIRSIDSAQYIEWKTVTMPLELGGTSVSFIWMFGIDANPDSHRFRLSFNGRPLLTFTNPVSSSPEPWTVSGEHGAVLGFRTTMLDKYDDPMGYAVLTVPLSLVKPGQAQVIRITGESAGSRSWYMTFEAPVEEKTSFSQQPAVIREGGKEWFTGQFRIVHLGKAGKCSISVPGIPVIEDMIQPGYNAIPLKYPYREGEARSTATIRVEGRDPVSLKVTFEPVKKWFIYLVQHTHTDIGYTRPQTEILPEHLRYIDYALDYCDQTDSLPDDARFRWTCETSWAVREYLETRPPAQVERFRRRVQEGRIEVTGLFLNGSDLSDEAAVAASLQPVGLFREKGFPVVSAMQSDINGIPWCLADYLPGCGIKYLNMAQNTHRARKPFDRPTPFIWESPSGSRLLVNRAEHYMLADQLGILNRGGAFADALFAHLAGIDAKGYPFDRYAIQFSGYLTDNSPPSTTACRLVKEWNETYEWPKLRLATVHEYMDWISANHEGELPVVRGAWPDWWMDGFGSAMLETAFTRLAHEDYIANNGLMAMAVLRGYALPPAISLLQQEITDDLLFYDEHTFGAAESITDPMAENSVVQWGEKSAYAWDAVKKNRILREEILGVLQESFPGADVPSVTVINTWNRVRCGIVTVYIDHQVIPPSRRFRVVDGNGVPVPVQAAGSREDGTFWALGVSDIPPMGYRTYRIYGENEDVSPGTGPQPGHLLENDFYRVDIDPATGTIRSIYDKQLRREFADTTGKYRPGQFIYETLGKNRGQLEQLQLNEYKREVPSGIRISGITEGPAWKSITVSGDVPGCTGPDGVTCEIRLYTQEKKIGFFWSMKKLPVTNPEAVYVAFPFTMGRNATFHAEVAGGPMVPGVTQVPRSASDWMGIQNFVSISDSIDQVIFVSPETPLIQPGGINLGRFRELSKPIPTAIYSWVLNNYWTTNFRAYMEGELKWTYYISTARDTSLVNAARFGWEQRLPMVARVFPAARRVAGATEGSLLGSSLRNLLLLNAEPAKHGKSVILQLREPSGLGTTISVSSLLKDTGAQYASLADIFGNHMAPLADSVTFRPWEVKFIKLDMKP